MINKSNTMLISIYLVGVLVFTQTCQSMSLNEVERGPYLLKRSLCNTFTGCGAKRSPQAQQPQPSGYELLGSRGVNYGISSGSMSTNIDAGDRSKLSTQSKKEANASLIAEILNDLSEYLRLNENYWQGKYVVLVSTKQITDNSQLNPSSFAVIGSGGQIQQLNPNDLQEVQMGRVYLSKNNEQI